MFNTYEQAMLYVPILINTRDTIINEIIINGEKRLPGFICCITIFVLVDIINKERKINYPCHICICIRRLTVKDFQHTEIIRKLRIQ
jgi:hypothetical protein